MQPHPDQIDSFSFMDGWSDEHQLYVAILRVGYWSGGSIDLRMPLERVLEFADQLGNAIPLVVGPRAGDGRLHRHMTKPHSKDSFESWPYPVTGFQFAPFEDGLAIVFEHGGLGTETVVLAAPQQAQAIADYARAWYHRPHQPPTASPPSN